MVDEEISEDDLPQRRAEDVVTVLFARLRDGVEGKRRERIRGMEADLRRCIEARAERSLSTPEIALLGLERQFRPEGAVARVASARVLLEVLPPFLEEPEWEGADDEDRRVRMRLTLEVARSTARLPELDGCDTVRALTRVQQAWRSARRRLSDDRFQRMLAAMPPERRATMEAALTAAHALLTRPPSTGS